MLPIKTTLRDTGLKVPEETCSDTLVPAVTRPEFGPEDWTCMVNLTTNVDEGSSIDGSVSKFDHLHELAKDTLGSHSQMLVQIFDAQKNEIVLFRIADGKTTPLGSACSKGYGQDVERFLGMAPHQGKLAFLNLGHGSASGVSGESHNYRVTMDEMVGSIQAGLAASGRQFLELVSLDSCDTANPNVISRFSKVTDNLIASETLEWNNGQEYYSAIGRAFKNSPANGKDLGLSIVDAAQQACDTVGGAGNRCSNETIALFDTQAAKFLNVKVSDLGAALSKTIENPHDKQVVQRLATGLPDVGISAELRVYHFTELRDLKAFDYALVEAVKEGKLSDPDHSLATAAEAVNAAQEKSIVKQFSHRGNWNGVNVLLPSQRNNPEFAYNDVVEQVKSVTREFEALDVNVDQKGYVDPVATRASVVHAREKLGGRDWLIPPSIEAPSQEKNLYSLFISNVLAKPQITSSDLKGVALFGEKVVNALEANRHGWLVGHAEEANRNLAETMKNQILENENWEKFAAKLGAIEVP
ncbi:MAG: hypothetical protein KGS72_24495 [Cyanobacteria bacterium REEB67]|nr:hypothetical protein [Cyanobacteria bacterium REEB67]